jgi:hypothetical protein
VRDYTIVTRSDSGAIHVGRSYQDRRTAFAQRTKVENKHEINAYVLTRKGERLTVYTEPTCRLAVVDLPADVLDCQSST